MPATVVTAYGTAPGGHSAAGVDINAEDVLDLIVDITPWETPVVTMLPKVQATNTRHEWVTDKLQTALPRGVGGTPAAEGADFGYDSTTLQTKVRRKNYLQHFRYELKVSALQRLMNPYGISDAYAYEVGKLTKQIGKDMEARMLEDTVVISSASYQGAESTTALMKTLGELIAEQDTNAIANGVNAGVRDAPTLTGLTMASSIWNGTTPTISAQTALTETIVTKALGIAHGGGAGGGVGTGDTGGGHPDMMIVSPAVYGMVGAWGGATTSGSYPFPSTLPPLTNARLARVVRFYDSNFGLIEVVNSRWCPQAINTGAATSFVRGANPGSESTTRNDGVMYLLERNRFRMAFARGVQHIAIPPAGDAARGMVVADVTTELLGSGSALMVVAVNNV